MKSTLIACFTSHHLLQKTHTGFLLSGSSPQLPSSGSMEAAEQWMRDLNQLLPVSLLHCAVTNCASTSVAPSLWLIWKQCSFYILYFHSLERGLPTTRVLFTCQKPQVTAKLLTMSSADAALQQYLGHSCRGSATKPETFCNRTVCLALKLLFLWPLVIF